jgi:hypothetical protein
MSPFSEISSRPMIEITISRTVLRRSLVIVPLSLLFLLGAIGAAISPLVNGHPVILTRERLALQYYLEEAQGWIRRFDELVVQLDILSSTSIAVTTEVLTSMSSLSVTLVPTGSLPAQLTLPSQTPLSAFTTPANQPTNLFDRAQAAEHAIQELQALKRDLEQIETPVALTGLQDIAAETVQSFAAWSAQVMDVIGAPTSETIAAAQVSRRTALTTLEALRQTLAQQPGTQP